MILVAEDDDALRRLIARILRNAGYAVLEAANGEDALSCAGSHGPIDLLVTDVAMPKIGGIELAQRLCACDADMRVMYMSGYPEVVIRTHGGLQPGASWMTKPFRTGEFLRQVRSILEATREAARAEVRRS